MNPLVLLPGLAVLLFTAIEMPRPIKKVFFRVPVWISSTTISILVGAVGRGVLGPMTGFMTELILFPGLYLTRKHFFWTERRNLKKKEKNDANFILDNSVDDNSNNRSAARIRESKYKTLKRA